MSHLETISNGLGAPSMALLILAARREIPATWSITADTGAEIDRLTSDGMRMTAEDFYRGYVEPYATAHQIGASFVRGEDRHKAAMPSLWDHTVAMVEAQNHGGIKIPLFGSNGGRLGQSCTQRWKIRAIRQEARRLGAKTIRAAHGIHLDEAARRMKGAKPHRPDRWLTLHDIDGSNKDGSPKIVRWSTRYYPLVELRMTRSDCERLCIEAGIPWITTSECDMCPHKDAARWLRTSPAMLEQIAEVEARMGGQFFFTSQRRPLMDVIADWQKAGVMQMELIDFGCNNSVCGV